jgi:hypothetical protein
MKQAYTDLAKKPLRQSLNAFFPLLLIPDHLMAAILLGRQRKSSAAQAGGGSDSWHSGTAE